ncbi:MAG: hypothetical protein JW798_05615 [Prolixibacteraceae bacterium]|nr:hypothetical protein [Prolixibacteraceae bacterium]
MKKILIALLILVSNNISAKNIIYTINAKYDGQNSPVDSVMFENLTTSSRIVFRQLDESGSYSFNLSTVSIINSNAYIEFCDLVKNVPGEVGVVFSSKIDNIKIGLYNLKGQTIEQKDIHLDFNHSLELKIPNGELYILKIESKVGRISTKVIGNNTVEKFKISQAAYKTLKSKSFDAWMETGIFQTGDSMRVSVFKNKKFAYPQGVNVRETDTLNFVLNLKKVDSTGISDIYVKSFNIDTIDFSFDAESNSSTILTNSAEGLHVGSIITVDMITNGILQKVKSIEYENGKAVIKTSPAYMDEIFVNKSFKLSTVLLEPENIFKSTHTGQQLQEALTDSAGYIHPTKIIYHTTDGRNMNKSVFDNNDERYSIIYLNEDISGTNLYGNVLSISNGFVSVDLAAVFEFDFEYEGDLSPDTKVEKGELNTFKFYFDGKTDHKVILAMDASGSDAGANNEPKKIFDLSGATACFNVFGIPVWISFDCDVFSNYIYNTSVDFHADWGFESHHSLQVGGMYKSDNNSFEPIYSFEHRDSVYSYNVDSEVDASARLEVYPRAEVMFYSFFGPYAEIVPYLGGNFKSKYLRTSIPEGESEIFLAWNGSIDVGLDFRTGTVLDFLFWEDEVYGPNVTECFNYRWYAPAVLEQSYNLPEETNMNEVFPLQFKVSDNESHGLSFFQLYIDGDGKFSENVAFTDEHGNVNINWTVSDTGYVAFSAKVFNPDSTVNLQYSDSVYVDGRTPLVNIVSIGNVTDHSVTVEGKVEDSFSYPVFDRGFYYGTECNPDSTGEKYSEISDATTFTSLLTGLKSNTIYHVKAYATNNIGTGLSNELTFKTEAIDSLLVYGQQTWMKKNMNVDLGSEYCKVITIWSAVPPIYLESPNYGLLYNWQGAQLVCPAGWHIPADEEWTKLAYYLADNGYNYDGTIGGGANKIAKAMASQTTDWLKPCEGDYNQNYIAPNSPGINTALNNTSGFNAYPTGYWYDGFGEIYDAAVWWTSSPGNDGLIINTSIEESGMIIRGIDVAHTELFRRVVNGYNDSYSWIYLGVRCIKDALLPAVATSDIITYADNEVMLRGTVEDRGTSNIIKRGVAIGEKDNFNINLWNYVEDGELDEFDDYEVIVQGLEPGTYYFRAFAQNDEGVAFGDEQILVID